MPSCLIYFKEITSGLDSGMTLQVINDYGYLSRQQQVYLQVYLRHQAEAAKLKNYLQVQNLSNLKIFFTTSKSKFIRQIQSIINVFAICSKCTKSKITLIIIIRDHKNLLIARLLRWIYRAKLITELHENGIPLSSDAKTIDQYRKLYNAVDAAIFTTPAQLEYLEKIGIKPPANLIVLPNGVNIANDLTQQLAKQPEITNKAKIILTYTGQFTNWKNIPLLFAALKLLPENYILRIAGGKINSGQSRQYLDNLLNEYKIESPRLDYRGFIAPENVYHQIILGSDLLLLPLGDSLIAQYATSPMKLVEYMSSQIAVLAVRAPSTLALADENCIYYSSANAKDFAQNIINAVNDNKQAEKIKNANIRAKEYQHSLRAERYKLWLDQLY